MKSGTQAQSRQAARATTARALTGASNAILTVIRYAGESILDDNSPFLIPIYIPSNAASVKLKLIGYTFPGFPYSELPYHRHSGVCVQAHTHGLASHIHELLAQEQIAYTMSTLEADPNVSDAASGTGNSGYSGTDSGTSVNDTKKTTVDDSITLNFSTDKSSWGTTYNKSSSGFSELANINGNAGTGEIEIVSYLTLGAYNFFKVAEPTAKKGGRIGWHVTIY